MKTTLFYVCALASTTMMAQEIKVKQSSSSFSSGTLPCFETKIYNNTMAEVKDQWKKILKNFKNEKIKTKGDELFGDNILIKQWGNNPVDIYTHFAENSDRSIEMKVAVDLGNGNYLESHDKDKSRFIEKLMKDFAVKMSTEALEKQLKEETKKLNDIQNKQQDLEKKNENLKKDIENYKEKIKKAEEEIKNNEKEIEKKKQEAAILQKRLDELKKKKESIR